MAHPTEAEGRRSIVAFRNRPAERELLKLAARESGSTLSELCRRGSKLAALDALRRAAETGDDR